MTAASERGTSATSPIRLRTDVFDELTARLGASSEIDRARLFDIDRTTLYRIRAGKTIPGLDLAMKMAERLGATVDQLFEFEQVA